jgi:ribosomal-protein-alanine N-acetyltransferase
MKEATRRKNVIYIRRPEICDADEFIRLSRASLKFYQGLATPVTTARRFEDYLKRCQQSDFEGFLICRREDDAIVGSINLSQIFLGGFKNAYLGYQIGEPFASRGYMTEALGLVLKYAFKTRKLHRLEANIQPGNMASIALVKRAGFTKEGYSRRYLKIAGRWRDHERWAIVVEDWQCVS